MSYDDALDVILDTVEAVILKKERLTDDLIDRVAELRAAIPVAGHVTAAPSPYLSRRLTLAERRQIAHALRQMAEATRDTSRYEAPLGAEAVEVILDEAREHDRLAGEVTRNGLQFVAPDEDDR